MGKITIIGAERVITLTLTEGEQTALALSAEGVRADLLGIPMFR